MAHGMAWHGMAWHGMAWYVAPPCVVCVSRRITEKTIKNEKSATLHRALLGEEAQERRLATSTCPKATIPYERLLLYVHSPPGMVTDV